MSANPALAWSVLWADCGLPGVLFSTYREARQHAAKLHAAGVTVTRIARVEIREVEVAHG